MLNIDAHSDFDDNEEDIDSYEFETDDENEDGVFDALPRFANEENRALHKLLGEKEEHLLKIRQKVTENENRIAVMAEHMKNVESELTHSRQILVAKDSEMSTEKHFSVLAQKEKHRLKADNKKSEGEIMEFQNQLNHIHNDIFQINEKIESFKLKMNWKNEELQQWTLAAKQKEEDQIALERYRRADELKIKNLNIELEAVSNAQKQMAQGLEREITETKAVQVELDNTASEFKKLHRQRVDIIAKWDDAVKDIHERDAEIIGIAKKVEREKNIANDHDIEIENKRQILNGQVAEEKSLRRDTAKVQRHLEKLRKEVLDHGEALKQERNEMVLMESELSKMDSENKASSLSLQNLTELNQRYLERLETQKQKLMEKIRELEDAKQSRFSTEKETNDIDVVLRDHELKLSNMVKAENNLKRTLIKQQTVIFELGKRQQSIENEIRGSTATTKNLLSKIEELDKRSLKQNESLYSLDFQIQQLERKVSRASGKRTREEQIELNEQIAAITSKLDIQRRHEQDLLNQVKKFGDDLRSAKKTASSTATKMDVLENRIKEINLENKSIEEEVDSLESNKQSLYVMHDEEKLNVNKIKLVLRDITERVFVLENKKVELSLILQKQLNDMEQVHKLNSTELKNRQNLLHNTKMEFTKCQQKIHALKAKYETLSARLPSADPDGDDDAENSGKSQVYIMIKMAQNKQELQDRGNTLDVAIRKSERELKLLYKSLRHLNHGNQLYRKSLHSQSSGDSEQSTENEEMEQIKMALSNKHRKITHSLYKHKERLKQIQSSLDTNQSRLALMNQQSVTLQSHIEKYAENESKLNRKLEQQRGKLHRALQSIKEKTKDQPLPTSLQLAELKRREKSMLEILKYLDEILQANNIHIEELSELAASGAKKHRKSVSGASSRAHSEDSSTLASSVCSSRPSTSSTVASSVISIVSLSPQF